LTDSREPKKGDRKGKKEMEAIGAPVVLVLHPREMQFLDLIREGNIDLMEVVDKFKCQAARSSPHMRCGGPEGVAEGGRPARQGMSAVKEWALARRDQLRENWRLARAGDQPERIAGLDAD
jgi:hypothetical protein